MTDAAEKSTFVVDANTLFVLGNGPSLRSVNLHDLTPFATLGMNAAYRYWKEIGWRPRYYACLDLVVGMSHRDAIAELVAETGEGAIRRFLLRENLIAALGPLSRSERVLNFDALQLAFPKLGVTPITTGSHAALWAAAEGFRKIVLLGVDGKYVERVDGAQPRSGIELEIVEEKANPNYFFDGYQRKGDRYNIPNPRPGLHIEAWEAAASVLRAEGVEIVNANPNSEIRFFPWAPIDKLISNGSAAVDATGVVSPRLTWAEMKARNARQGGGLRRLGKLISQQINLLSALTVLFVGSAGFSLAMLGPGAVFWTALLQLVLLCILFVVTLAMRDAISDHLGRHDQRISAIESALRDIDRRGEREVSQNGREVREPDASNRQVAP